MFSHHLVAYPGKQQQLTLAARLSQTRRTSTWAPLMAVCVTGANAEQQGCIRFVSTRGKVGMVNSTARNGEKFTEKRVPGASFRAGQIMTIAIRPRLRGYAVVLEGVELYSASTGFDVAGYDVSCSSAKCEFDVGVSRHS